ncbi:MAG: hypothetical protein NTZ49_02010 [Candidatus Parcubacteria bacterium]|nr:hypothetical protein [Candidatus Parcubacteria bacterium]
MKAKTIILVGIYVHPVKGLLMIQSPSGNLLLPGGKINHSMRPRMSQIQKRRENLKLQQTTFEKSGFMLDPAPPIVLYPIKGMLYKCFRLIQSTTLNLCWAINPNYKAIYLQPDLEMINNMPEIPDEDKKIINDFLGKGSVKSADYAQSVCNIVSL